jgi:hypothetical protein
MGTEMEMEMEMAKGYSQPMTSQNPPDYAK